MKNRVLKVLNLFALLFAVAWVVTNFDWEPLITFVTLLSTFLLLIFKKDESLENNADLKLFKKFNSDLPPYNINFIEQNSLKAPFLRNIFEPFFNFESLWKDVHHNFLNKKLNKKKLLLHSSLSNFNKLVALNTFPTNNPNVSCVPKEWELNNKQRYIEVCKKIDEAQDEVIAKYNGFVEYAKKTLKV